MCRVFFFNDTATTEIYTLSLHDALPISRGVDAEDRVQRRDGPIRPERELRARVEQSAEGVGGLDALRADADRKSTRLNSSHLVISYTVFCLKKKGGGVDHELDPPLLRLE